MSEASTRDEELFARLRDLALVDLEAAVGHQEPARAAELADALASDLEHALVQARERAIDLVAEIRGGGDPLVLVGVSRESRGRDGGREIAARAVSRLTARATACATLARLDELAARVVPRLVEADRRRA
ncbi:MAG TPA: hypothetical protein VML75_14795 [Kofleriaceae bacterium]|nr:hypothetical protein [Kofleriaceae bacterium]